MVARELAQKGVPVICGPVICTRGKPELRNLRRDNLRLLNNAGVTVSVNTDAPEVPIDMLLTSVAIAAQGLPSEKAVECVTCNAADAAGISSRVGRIAVGLDADLLLFDCDPVGLLQKPQCVMLDGSFISCDE